MPPRLRSVVPTNTLTPSTACTNINCMSRQSVRELSSSPCLQKRYRRPPTRQRRALYSWLHGNGAAFREPLPGSTNYLTAYNRFGDLTRVVNAAADRAAAREAAESDRRQGGDEGKDADNKSPAIPPETMNDLRPFPLNRDFVSQPVASEELREAVWSRIMKDGKSVAAVSAELGVSMERVGAIVRLKEIEKEWLRKRKPLASPYARAVMDMLPKTQYPPPQDGPFQAHESINDLPVHTATTAQVFWPTSESRHFTRLDAAKIFQDGLKPADERVPHPELTILEKERVMGFPFEERIERARARHTEEERLKAIREERRKKQEAAALTVVDKGRWEFRFKDISVEAAGKDGRGPGGVGKRYGVPHDDRRRGLIKIPRSVL